MNGKDKSHGYVMISMTDLYGHHDGLFQVYRIPERLGLGYPGRPGPGQASDFEPLLHPLSDLHMQHTSMIAVTKSLRAHSTLIVMPCPPPSYFPGLLLGVQAALWSCHSRGVQALYHRPC